MAEIAPAPAPAPAAARFRCSYKRATFVLCAGNLVVALYLLQSVVAPLYFQTSTNNSNHFQGDDHAGGRALQQQQQQEVIYSEEDLKRQEESNDLRRAVFPVRLMERVKEIEAQTEMEISKSQSASAARQRVALALAQHLRYLRFLNSKSNQQEEELSAKNKTDLQFNSRWPDRESNTLKSADPDENGESTAADLVRKKTGLNLVVG